MMHRNRLLSLTIALALLLPNAARAQTATGPPCADRTSVVHNLHNVFGERLVGYGLSTAGTLIEVYAGRAGTWTIISTRPNGTSCLVATGEAWEAAKPPYVQTRND